jgi:hypothetical protein
MIRVPSFLLANILVLGYYSFVIGKVCATFLCEIGSRFPPVIELCGEADDEGTDGSS